MTNEEYFLVGISSNVGVADLVRRKLDTYLSRLPECQIVALNDVKGILRGYFSDRLLDSVEPFMPLRDKRKLVAGAFAAVFFWDGSDISDFVQLAMYQGKAVKVVPVSTTRVINKERGDEFDAYIGRGTPWGNPFVVGESGLDRAESVRLYREMFRTKFIDSEQGNREIRSLKGKVLACHCKPLACHGDVIADYLNSLED
jgi:hypothetical protein